MNVFHKITLQSLKKNRIRTIVTIIGVILSVAMFTAVTTLISSMQYFSAQNEIARSGDWHVKFKDVDVAFMERIAADKEVKSAGVMHNIGYALLEGGQNPYKPYLFVVGFDDAAFANFTVDITEGRLPQTGREVVVSEHIETNGGIDYKVGDTITLPLGSRTAEGIELGQDTQFVADESGSTETFTPTGTRTYTVVGICARPGFEGYGAAGYTVITTADAQAVGEAGSSDAYVVLKSPGKVYDYAEKTAGDIPYEYNRELLRYYGVSTNDNFNTVLYSLGAILMGLIMVASILLIYNAFAISVSERTGQFGILSSVGATKKQLRKSVLFEGVCIGAIGIPLGLLAGLGGIGITLRLIGDITRSMAESDIPLLSRPSPASLIAATLIGVVTILISAYIPARRAMKQSAIDTIRQANDIKINPKSVKTSGMTSRLFGLERTLALKNFKRNKKRYRSTVISLFVSIVLFISASAFGMYFTQGTAATVEDVNYDLLFSSSNVSMEDEELLGLYDKMKRVEGVYQSAYRKLMNGFAFASRSDLSERFLEYDGTLDNPGDINGMTADIYFLEDSAFSRYLDMLGLGEEDYGFAQGKLPAMAKIKGYSDMERRVISIDIFNRDEVKLDVAASADAGQEDSFVQGLTLTVVDAMPEEFAQAQTYNSMIFAPYSDISELQMSQQDLTGINMAFLSTDPMKSAAEMETVIKDAGIASGGYMLLNTAEWLARDRNNLLVINILTYGFVILISLITIANVFNTISTSIHLRRREFAMLRSVGMGDRSFNRMMNFECIVYGCKSLLYGLPVSVAITWLIYRSMLAGVDVSFDLPWGSVAISVFGVFFVVFVTMLYATAKLKKANVIDALRDDVI